MLVKKVATTTIMVLAVLTWGALAKGQGAGWGDGIEQPVQQRPPAADKSGTKKLKLDVEATDAILSPDGNFLATISRRAPKAKGENRQEEENAAKSDVPAGAGYFATIKVWDVRKRELKFSLGEVEGPGYNSFGFSPDSKTLTITETRPISEGSKPDKVELWNVETGQLVRRIELAGGNSIMGFSYAPNGKLLAVAGGEATKTRNGVRIVDVQTGDLKRTLQVDGGDVLVSEVAFFGDGLTVVGVGSAFTEDKQRILFWDVKSGKQTRFIKHPGDTIRSLAISRDSKRLATGGIEKDVLIWNLKTEKADVLDQASEWTDRIAFTADGNYLAAYGSNAQDKKRVSDVRLWDLQTMKLLRVWENDAGLVGFSADSRHLTIVDADKTLRSWNLKE